jgi:hypothetical protein
VVEIEELGISRGDNLRAILDKARDRRGQFLTKAGFSKDELVKAIYYLSSEICELEKLLTIILPTLER